MVKGFFQKVRSNRKGVVALVAATALFLYWNILPDRLFDEPLSLVLEDKDGQLMGAMIADDGQWRFPSDTSVPEKFEKCILTFEDKRFYSHFGIDPLSVGRAVKQNFSRMETVSGASTITMQVIRLSRNQGRTIAEKLIEALMATRLEMKHSKKEILAMYAANAPFGGNVIGLNAASWRYYGKSSKDLSWGEAAALAVLPNNPSVVHPGKNRTILKNKRNRLLRLLLEENLIDSNAMHLAMLESIPDKPQPLPALAPHLLAKIFLDLKREKKEMQVYPSSLSASLQSRVNSIVNSNAQRLRENGIYNAAVLVSDVHTGKVLAYCGNVEGTLHHENVDNIQSSRSTGSILKPLLYASMLNEGKLFPDMLVPDIPTFINSYTPKNFNYTYDGVVPASIALSRSLNIPAVHMLKSYTPERFIHKLKSLGLTTLNRSAKAYGLSLILGGAEAKLWDLASVYGSMARTLSVYNKTGKYRKDEYCALSFYRNEVGNFGQYTNQTAVLSAGAIYTTFDAMLKVARPDEDKFWSVFASGRKIAWKTGTSFGNRDAWAIGCTPDYVVAVWVGNSSGEGRTGMTGIHSAAPILFDVFNILPDRTDWFAMPAQEMEKVLVCAETGYAASEVCPSVKEVFVPKSDVIHSVCPFHHLVHLDKKEEYRVHGDCEDVSDINRKVWLVLPPSVEKYYKLSHPSYRELPPYRNDCAQITLANNEEPMDMIYPSDNARIKIPVRADGNASSIVFEAVHANLSASLYWHIDEKYMGNTGQGLHEMAFVTLPGKHKLTLVDDAGNRLEREFEVIE